MAYAILLVCLETAKIPAEETIQREDQAPVNISTLVIEGAVRETGQSRAENLAAADPRSPALTGLFW